MKLIGNILLYFLLLGFHLTLATEYTVATVPNPMKTNGSFVSNPDKILSMVEENSINTKITVIEKKTTAEIAVVVVNSIGDSDPNEFANKLFELWGIGKKKKDNGLLLLVVTDRHLWKIETGYGLEGILPDIICHKIGAQILVPNFKSGNYGQGVLSGIEQIGGYIKGDSAVNSNTITNTDTESIPDSIIMILFCLYMLLTVGGSYSFYHYFFKKIINKAESPDAAYNNLQSYTRGPIIGALIAAFLVPGAILCLWLVVTRKKLRAMPRVSKKNGKPMHRLTEAEEDKFLSSGQILEEKLKSRDYDVWVTDDEDDVVIINYLENATNYTQCSSCQFVTDHLIKVVTIKKATTSRAGQQKCFYKCLQCSNEREALEKIPRISSSSSSSYYSSSGFGSAGENSSFGSSSGSFGGGRSGGGGAEGKW
jgi:uncharacterized protein